MKHQKIQPTGLEAAFGIDELFFSTTDQAGVIRSCNSVFVRLSKHSLENLLGAPHNIIRHPGMPRSVFKLFWDELLAGRSIAAYVQNLAADGSHYWVFALATPIQDGFLSVRMKPSSELFKKVPELYRSLVATEKASREQGERPAEGMRRSGEQLLESLASLGFEDYCSFMYAAFRDEMRCRDEALRVGSAPERDREHFDRARSRSADALHAIRAAGDRLSLIRALLDELVGVQERLGNKVAFADDISRRFQYAATNTAIRAASFGSKTQALGTIAANLAVSARSVDAGAISFRDQARRTIAALKRNTFHIESVRLGLEAAEKFCLESCQGQTPPAPPGAVHQSLEVMLVDLTVGIGRLLDAVEGSIHHLGSDLSAMARDTEGLRRTVLSIRFGQLAGVIEAARLNAQSTVGPLLTEIGANIESAQHEFSELASQIEALGARVADLPPMLRSFRARLDVVTSSTDVGIQAA